MRDNHQHMVELLDVSRIEGVHSPLVRHEINGKAYKIRFGIQPLDYNKLKRILEFRPFENTGAGVYRYFFVRSYRPHGVSEELIHIGVRVEQLSRNKQYEFEVSKAFVANILWFQQLKSTEEIQDLIEE
jgi:hypothetical protein